MNFSAVILAGGKSSRMGQDKARLLMDGQTLLARQIQLVRAVGAAEIFISGRAGEDYSEFQRPILHDRFPDTGPLGGIERALAATPAPLLLVLAVDMPRMSTEMLIRLKNLCTGERGIVPRKADQLETLAALYPKSAHPLAAKQLAEHHYTVRDFAEHCHQSGLVDFYDVPAAYEPCFSNWNTPEDGHFDHGMCRDSNGQNRSFDV